MLRRAANPLGFCRSSRLSPLVVGGGGLLFPFFRRMPNKKKSSSSVIKNDRFITKAVDGTVKLNIHVRPGAKSNRIKEITRDLIEVDVSAPPTDGKANTELCIFIASVLNVPKKDVSLIEGRKSRNKVVAVQQIVGQETEDLEQKLLSSVDTKKH